MCVWGVARDPAHVGNRIKKVNESSFVFINHAECPVNHSIFRFQDEIEVTSCNGCVLCVLAYMVAQ
eukprot:4072022-Prorocentrum_lima.AAC.1